MHKLPPTLQLILCACIFVSSTKLEAGQMRIRMEFGQKIVWMRQGPIEVKLAPESGANVYSIRVDGTEYLHQPESAEKLAGVACGVPLLYPTPNRVAEGRFTFDGKEVQFPIRKNAKWFIHGLVNRYSWSIERSHVEKDSVAITCLASFAEKSELGKQFPFPHDLRVTVRVDKTGVRWTYEVDNKAGSKAVPFGFALHPYFIYQGKRSHSYLTIPASHWMKAEERMPTGSLVPPEAYDGVPLGKPFSLEGVSLDDVYYGMQPEKPVRLEFRDVKRSVLIRASAAFTHLVVWTPNRPFLGVESQTCSTDAHNLYSRGLIKESHLQVCAPGEVATGWVQYEFPTMDSDGSR